jgi:hypothetical protein
VRAPVTGSRAPGRLADLHCYVVFHFPLKPEWVGVHDGGSRAWKSLCAACPKGRFSPGYIDLKRCESLEQGLALYEAKSKSYEAPGPVPVFRH